MTCVLITAIGGDVAQGVARVLREAFPSWRLVGTDMGDRHGGAYFVDVVCRAPPATDGGYMTWLQATLAEFAADYFLPMSEAELSVVAQLGLMQVGAAQLVAAPVRAIRAAEDKLATAELLRSIGLPAPWSAVEVDALGPEQFPCIYKPRRGSGSKAVYVCANGDEAKFFASRHPGGMFQELLLPDDSEITCSLFRDASGRIAVLQLLRQLVGGATGWARVIDDRDVREQCERIAEALNLRGAINVQLRLTADGPRVFEINARFSSTALMRHRMGFQDVVWVFQDLQGILPQLQIPPVGTCAARVQEAAVLPLPC
jgi:carbamoyl-phosphate synthase large subunit